MASQELTPVYIRETVQVNRPILDRRLSTPGQGFKYLWIPALLLTCLGVWLVYQGIQQILHQDNSSTLSIVFNPVLGVTAVMLGLFGFMGWWTLGDIVASPKTKR